MKLLTACLVLFLFCSCSNPQKILEKGDPNRALTLCLKKLKNGKVKSEHLHTFQKAFKIVTKRDRADIDRMRNSGKPSIWPVVYRKVSEVSSRQYAAESVENRLRNEGFKVNLNYLPTERLRAEAAENSAIYYYARAQEQVLFGRNGDREKARQAYHFLEKCLSYVSDFRDAGELLSEMKDAGTTHILLRSVLTGNVWQEEALLNDLLGPLPFPMIDEWQIIHRTAPTNQIMDFIVDAEISQIYVSPNRTDESCCQAERKIKMREKVERIWDEKDSVWTEIRTPIYETIRARVVTTEQTKTARADLQLFLIATESQTTIDQKDLSSNSCWNNTFSDVSGDSRALCGSTCNDEGGFWHSFPSDNSMVSSAIGSLRGRLRRYLKKMQKQEERYVQG